jgi:hypothetical protein
MLTYLNLRYYVLTDVGMFRSHCNYWHSYTGEWSYTAHMENYSDELYSRYQ